MAHAAKTQSIFLYDLGQSNPIKFAWFSGKHYLMESMIGEYSSYQAALCAYNLEGHMISHYADEKHKTTKYYLVIF